jgi:hypothetical protein
MCLLNSGADWRAVDHRGYNPASLACSQPSVVEAVVKVLIERATTADWQSHWSTGVLSSAAQSLSSEKCMLAIVEAGDQEGLLIHEPTIVEGLRQFLTRLILPVSPIEPRARVLWWALSSPADIRLPRARPAVFSVAGGEQARAIIAVRLKPLRNDAWRKRRHLAIAKAVWKHGYRPERRAAPECEEEGKEG